MTDMPEHHAVRSFAMARPRAGLAISHDIVQRLCTAVVGHFCRPAFDDHRSKAERARLADSLREEARRKVDRLLI